MFQIPLKFPGAATIRGDVSTHAVPSCATFAMTSWGVCGCWCFWWPLRAPLGARGESFSARAQSDGRGPGKQNFHVWIRKRLQMR